MGVDSIINDALQKYNKRSQCAIKKVDGIKKETQRHQYFLHSIPELTASIQMIECNTVRNRSLGILLEEIKLRAQANNRSIQAMKLMASNLERSSNVLAATSIIISRNEIK